MGNEPRFYTQISKAHCQSIDERTERLKGDKEPHKEKHLLLKA